MASKDDNHPLPSFSSSSNVGGGDCEVIIPPSSTMSRQVNVTMSSRVSHNAPLVVGNYVPASMCMSRSSAVPQVHYLPTARNVPNHPDFTASGSVPYVMGGGADNKPTFSQMNAQIPVTAQQVFVPVSTSVVQVGPQPLGTVRIHMTFTPGGGQIVQGQAVVEYINIPSGNQYWLPSSGNVVRMPPTTTTPKKTVKGKFSYQQQLNPQQEQYLLSTKPQTASNYVGSWPHFSEPPQNVKFTQSDRRIDYEDQRLFDTTAHFSSDAYSAPQNQKRTSTLTIHEMAPEKKKEHIVIGFDDPKEIKKIEMPKDRVPEFKQWLKHYEIGSVILPEIPDSQAAKVAASATAQVLGEADVTIADAPKNPPNTPIESDEAQNTSQGATGGITEEKMDRLSGLITQYLELEEQKHTDARLKKMWEEGNFWS